MYFKYAFLTCLLCAVSGNNLQKLKTNIFYEPLDDSSISFFSSKLHTAYNKLNPFVDFNLVPFGKSQLNQTINTTTFLDIKCEHGSVECYAIKVHACAIHLLRSPEDQIEFVVCTMNSTNPKNVTEHTYPTDKCIGLVGATELTKATLDYCIANISAGLVAKYANETKLINTTHLPVVTLNAEPFNAQLSSDLVKDFEGVLCQKLSNVPGASSVCKNNSTTPFPNTTPHPNSATIIPTTYWPLFVAIVLTVLFEVKLRY